MIFGECPHCDEPIVNYMPDNSPAVWKTDCEHCHETYWMYASRIGDCMAYPDRAALEKDYTIDDKMRKFEPVVRGLKRV